MLYFYLGLASIACCILQGIIYGWFQSSQDNNLHNIVDLWTKDPIEKAFFVPFDAFCPEGTSEEAITFNYEGTSGLCICEQTQEEYSDDRYLKGTRPRKPSNTTKTNTSTPTKVPQECSQLQCLSGQEKVTKVDPISSQTLYNFFAGQKVCTRRIQGYSFAKQAPEEQECGNDEKYCSWNSKSKTFDVDHGYCIPKESECYQTGVQVPQQSENIQQLPLLGFRLSETSSSEYNILNNKSNLNEKQLLDINQVSYTAEYQSYLTKTYIFQSIYMPRVKSRCRESLKDTLSHYIGPDGAKSISLASLIISVFAVIIVFFYSGIGDICDLSRQQKNKQCRCDSYCQNKRVSVKHSKLKNFLLVAKPILLIVMLILNILIVKDYISILNEMNKMIEDGCLDQYVSTSVGYGQYFQSSFYDSALTYASLGLIGANILFDQNIYYLIKTVILAIFCKCNLQKKQETQNEIKTSPESSVQNEGLKKNQVKQENIQTQNGLSSLPIIKSKSDIKQEMKREQNKLFSRQKPEDKQDEQKNQNDIVKQEFMKFNKYNTKEFVMPPDAPAPPEQSEQLNNSVRDEDFSKK